MIDLQPFCSTDERRPNLLTPWSRGDWTYATRGYIAVWVPRRPDVAENDAAPDVKMKIADKLDFSKCVPWVAMEFPDPERAVCELCCGRGTEHDCPDCSCECEHCNGLGEYDVIYTMHIGNEIVNVQYIRLMQTLRSPTKLYEGQTCRVCGYRRSKKEKQ